MRVAILLTALALCACGREPSFDERFSDAEKDIEERARELDNHLNDANAAGESSSSPLRD